MPIYEYQCQLCHHQLEVLQKVSEAPLTECPACHQPSLKKLVSATSFQLQGTGWYATDYKPKAQPADAKKPPQEGAKQEINPTQSKDTSTNTTDPSSGSGSGSSA